jgi:lipopolysaccharide transport system ATP-binding protein
MYVRLAFAVAAHLEPEILVVDEVLAVGDMAFQAKCMGKMGDIGREGRTVLLVSHNMPSVINLCSRAILLRAGGTVADGPSKSVVQGYLSAARSDSGEAVWVDPTHAPGNELGRLHAVRILQEGIAGPTSDVDISKDILVQIQYWCQTGGTQLYPAIWLKDNLGTFVLASHNARSISLTDDPWYGKPHPLGLFESVCIIPGNFLNDGRYNISVILGKLYNIEVATVESVVSFHVHDTGAMREDYYGPWIGPVIRPRLQWQTEYLGEQLPSPLQAVGG